MWKNKLYCVIKAAGRNPCRLFFAVFSEKALTIISAAVIINISEYDIPKNDIGGIDLPNPALTEAVYYILLSLTEPLHGYGIMQHVEQLSRSRVKLAAGTLYGALNTLLEKGWITALSEGGESRKKEYVITALGREMLDCELARLKELLENGRTILGVKA